MSMMQSFVAKVVEWIFKAVTIKFVIFTAIFSTVEMMLPFIIEYLGDFIKPHFIQAGFSDIDTGVWFFLQFFSIGFGVKIIVSAYVYRFMIRRIPFLG
ncbi:hypothetical protein FACS1894116_01480 [Betaproteobacteria bacterium]|nr:hypothetical protein FACS1894116_01480 [Betaproteobacteria bacterium]GHU02612.1 hypothetical protein FACS1894154_12470 [Betaproteobacteria bacterium]GHU24940.1 hypothetical protein FACS189488_10730 [Betaproteobacteria bacterium]GHU28473.1 hypothetical protein FACS189497_04020 [Betaproteobacteria bacterium]